MTDFGEIARAAARQKAEKEEQEKARQEKARQESAARLRADEEAMDSLVVPVLRDAKKALAAEGVTASLNLDRNAPTMAKALILGHTNTSVAAERQAVLRVEREQGQFAITVVSRNGPPASWKADDERLRELLGTAYEDTLKRWHGLSPYR